jgi:ABC-type transport system involved in cytochrome bd biosynthesis fused ATPase/permease subunit
LKPKFKERASPPVREADRGGLPEFAVSLFLVLLMWLFAELVFLPLSAESFTRELSGRVTAIVAAVFILAIGYLLPQTAWKGEAAVKMLSDVLVKSRYARRKREKMRPVFENLGRALLSAILGIILSSLLYWIHPVFGGMAMLVTVILTFIFVFQGASQASDEILGRVGH